MSASLDPPRRSPDPPAPPGGLESLCDRVLIELGVPHGFGQKGSQVPEKTTFIKQVHGVEVYQVSAENPEQIHSEPPTADALWSAIPGSHVGIVTADCVPILVSDRAGECVAAIHSGWRGLAAGVIEAGVEALPKPASELVAAVGPAARGCCYEVDAPVRNGLNRRYRAHLDRVLSSGRAGHYQLDLPLLATYVLEDLGIPAAQIGVEQRLCTICHPERFESYRREGPSAGRLRHFIGAKPNA